MSKWLAVVSLLMTSCIFAQSYPPKEQAPRISYTITKGKILKMVKPVYPKEAWTKRLLGRVSVDIIIDKQGAVKVVRVLKGDPVLARAASKAVSQWQWEPYKVNGEPVEVESTITVNFEPR